MNQPDYQGEDPGPNRQFKAGQRRMVLPEADTAPYLNPGDIVTLQPVFTGDTLLEPTGSDWLALADENPYYGRAWYIHECFLSEEEVTE